MKAAEAVRQVADRHAFLAPLAAVFAVALVLLIAFDRKAPLTFLQGEVRPEMPVAGQTVSVRWHTIWNRRCQGTVSREIVGPDLIIRAYRRHWLRVPVRLGQQVSDTDFQLDKALPVGATIYRAVVRFEDCGLTSRLWPIEVVAPELWFDVRGG